MFIQTGWQRFPVSPHDVQVQHPPPQLQAPVGLGQKKKHDEHVEHAPRQMSQLRAYTSKGFANPQ